MLLLSRQLYFLGEKRLKSHAYSLAFQRRYRFIESYSAAVNDSGNCRMHVLSMPSRETLRNFADLFARH